MLMLLRHLLLAAAATSALAADPAPAPARAPSAPTSTGSGGPASPPSKRVFNERVTFHSVAPEVPGRPSRTGNDSRLPGQEERAVQRPVIPSPKPLDPMRERVPRAEARLPTKQELEQLKRQTQWLDPARFADPAERADRDLLDEALGLRSAEGGDADSEATSEEGQEEPFGSYFDRAREEFERLTRMTESVDETEEENPPPPSENAGEANSASTPTATDIPQNSVGDLAPVRWTAANPGREETNGSARSGGDPLSPRFTPLFSVAESPSANRPASAGYTYQDAGFLRATSGLTAAPARAQPATLSPAPGEGAATARPGPGLEATARAPAAEWDWATAPRAPAQEPSFLSPSASAEPRGAPSGWREGPGARPFREVAGPGPRSAFPPPDAGGPPTSARFQPALGNLPSAAMLPPAISSPAGGDRWAKDRLQSQLLGERTPRPGARLPGAP